MRSALLLTPLVLVGAACGGDTGDPKVGACEDYCDLIAAHCSGAEAQYPDRPTCLATCAAMDKGDPATHTGNTIACRTFQAAAAELDPAGTCAGAGPGGAGVCGDDCASFCAMGDVICGADFPYASTAECLTACAGFTSTPPFDASDLAGNTRECRLYHLTAAAIDPTLHCPHTGATSATCI